LSLSYVGLHVDSKTGNSESHCVVHVSAFIHSYRKPVSRDSWVDIATVWLRSLAVARHFYLLCSFHTSSEDHATSCPLGTGSCFPGGKAAETWSSHIFCRDQDYWSCIFRRPDIFIAWRLVNRTQRQLYIFWVCETHKKLMPYLNALQRWNSCLPLLAASLVNA
jgi:hypothetical protein